MRVWLRLEVCVQSPCASRSPALRAGAKAHSGERVAGQLPGKPLFVGEFGVPGPKAESEEAFGKMLQVLVDQGVPLAALWTLGGQGKDAYGVSPSNERGYQLRLQSRINKGLRGTAEG